MVSTTRTQGGNSEVVLPHDLHLCLKRGGEIFEQILLYFFLVSFISNLTEYDEESCSFQQLHHGYKPFESGLHWNLGSGPWLHFQRQHLCEWHGYNTHLHLQPYIRGVWPVKGLNGISQPWDALWNVYLFLCKDTLSCKAFHQSLCFKCVHMDSIVMEGKSTFIIWDWGSASLLSFILLILFIYFA